VRALNVCHSEGRFCPRNLLFAFLRVAHMTPLHVRYWVHVECRSSAPAFAPNDTSTPKRPAAALLPSALFRGESFHQVRRYFLAHKKALVILSEAKDLTAANKKLSHPTKKGRPIRTPLLNPAQRLTASDYRLQTTDYRLLPKFPTHSPTPAHSPRSSVKPHSPPPSA
jgi:hypothetical protein